MKTRVLLAVIALAITLTLAVAAYAQGYPLLEPADPSAATRVEILHP